MQNAIHPHSEAVNVVCSSCGNNFTTYSTLCRDIHVEKCSNCHHVYTGKRMQVRSVGQVERFRNRFGDL